MTTPKKVNTPTAVTHSTPLDLSCQHITTSNFMQLGVVKSMELVPKQKITVDLTTFARFEPLAVPTFGNADINNRAYFVPFRTIMRGWDEFYNDTTCVDANGNEVIPIVPFIRNIVFVETFRKSLFSTVVSSSLNAADIEIKLSDGGIERRLLTNFGRNAYKLLYSLGYRISFDERTEMVHSLLPLFALMRVYFDWYYPSAYVDDERSLSLRKWFDYGPTDDPANYIDDFDSDSLSDILFEINSVCYDSDYFVSAWDNPVAPNNGAYSDFDIYDPTTGDNTTYNIGDTGTAVADTGNGYLSQFAIDSLKSVSDYMRRHQIAGARVLDRFMAQWGIRLPEANLRRSSYIGFNKSKVSFGDVTSTSDTVGAPLGSFAGKGIGYNGDDNTPLVDFTATEFGMLIILSSVVPKTSYYQGQDRMTFHLSRFDFYNPEFDNLGVQALATREVYMPVVGDYSQYDDEHPIDFDHSVFGFVPRYSEYKRGYDNMTGDYILNSKNAGKEGWTLMRDLRSYFSDLHVGLNGSYSDVVHSQSFVESLDKNQYNRIFNVVDENEDKLNVIHDMRISTVFPGRPMYESYEFKDEDKAQKVQIDINGVRAN